VYGIAVYTYGFALNRRDALIFKSPTAIFFLSLQKEYGKKNRPKRGEETPSLETPKVRE